MLPAGKTTAVRASLEDALNWPYMTAPLDEFNPRFRVESDPKVPEEYSGYVGFNPRTHKRERLGKIHRSSASGTRYSFFSTSTPDGKSWSFNVMT